MRKNYNDGVSATAFAIGDNESQNMIPRYDFNLDNAMSRLFQSLLIQKLNNYGG